MLYYIYLCINMYLCVCMHTCVYICTKILFSISNVIIKAYKTVYSQLKRRNSISVNQIYVKLDRKRFQVFNKRYQHTLLSRNKITPCDLWFTSSVQLFLDFYRKYSEHSRFHIRGSVISLCVRLSGIYWIHLLVFVYINSNFWRL